MTFSSDVAPSRRVLTILTLATIGGISADIGLALILDATYLSETLQFGYLIWILAVALFWLHPAAGALAALTGGVLGVLASSQFETMLLVILFCGLSAMYCSRWVRRLYALLALCLAVNAGLVQSDALLAAGFGITIGALMLLCYFAGHATRKQLVSRMSADQELVELRAAHEDALAGERRSIARDLHDILAHDLTVISMQTQVAAATGTPESRAAALSQISQSASAALHDLRRVLLVLQRENIIGSGPGDAPELDLESGLARFTERLQDLGFTVDTSVHGDISSISQSVEACLYRILQECTTNVVKHGARGHDTNDCTIELEVKEATVDLAVTNRTDANQAPAPKHATSGTGLISMEDRAATYGGTIEAGSPAEGIWSVQVSGIQLRLPR
ncbi:sensor histidine kinase [Nesterenkonia halotolerans]|uniref:histidine kinase n=1 Tax=Nesterenkonia halotolerans TaxID=225325 RepID=A0ABR9J9L2_9MICC|nr:histidine kinase [Nesterenkonia halotolerans]MBE1515547.1 signal transduction histidine kinase [Nesterenkonia halotolerans]